MPAMKAASNPVTATPRTPVGRYFSISSGIALLYWYVPVSAPSCGNSTSAIRPGMIVSAGMKSFGYAPMSGVRRAAFMSLADSARCTSAKFVVQ